jgi:hypothetical protein
MIASNRTLVIATLIAFAVLSRLIPHPPNFAAVGAVGLFAGASLANRWLSLLIPIGAMLISDIVIGFHWMCVIVYAAMALYVVAGWWAGHQIDARRLLVASLAGSVGFFIVTNFACWLSMYERSWSGFVACYVAAIPFFQNTLASDLIFGTSLFAILKVAELKVPSLRFESALAA